jgi:hypothetical protein
VDVLLPVAEVPAVDRRAYLATISAALSGCNVGYAGGRPPPGSRTPTEPRAEADVVQYGVPATLCEEEIKPGAIPPIVDPAFDRDWSDVEVREEYGDLSAEQVVVGLTADDRARAYPVSVLRHHEAVNERFGGPVLLTYCSICRSGLVAERRVDGVATQFAASGLLWRPPGEYTAASEAEGTTFGASTTDPDADVRNGGNVVLYDAATGSYWSQLLAQAVCGPRTGDELAIVPSTVTTWAGWRDDHPQTEVLLPPPASETVDDGLE